MEYEYPPNFLLIVHLFKKKIKIISTDICILEKYQKYRKPTNSADFGVDNKTVLSKISVY